MSRAISLALAIIAYAVSLATFLYLIIFVGGFSLGAVAPKTVDEPASQLPVGAALVLNLALIALFGVQHSLMAHRPFKRAWAGLVPRHAERSLYVLLSSLMLVAMFRFWQPIGTVVWTVREPLVHDMLFLLFWIGWLAALVGTLAVNYFELFKVQQAWLNRGARAEPPESATPPFSRWVRHPLYAAFFLAFWATPEMSVGHLLLAAGMSAYMLIAMRREGREGV
jgi:protein-S-isoprenylcysteine O-methyltransferase Ste14